MSFCNVCGQRLIAVDAGTFNMRTGERLTRDVCPSDHCSHYGVTHDAKNFIGILKEIATHRCSVCGDWLGSGL